MVDDTRFFSQTRQNQELIGLVLWLVIEGILIGWWPITTITAIQGGLILIAAFPPTLSNQFIIKEIG